MAELRRGDKIKKIYRVRYEASRLAAITEKKSKVYAASGATGAVAADCVAIVPMNCIGLFPIVEGGGIAAPIYIATANG